MPARDDERLTSQPARHHPARAAARPPWWRSRRVQTAAASIALVVAAGVALVWLWQAVAPMLSRQGGPQEQKAGAVAESLPASKVERIWATARRIWRRMAARPAEPAPAAVPAESPGAEPVIVAPTSDRPPAPASPSETAASRMPAAAAGTSPARPGRHCSRALTWRSCRRGLCGRAFRTARDRVFGPRTCRRSRWSCRRPARSSR